MTAPASTRTAAVKYMIMLYGSQQLAFHEIAESGELVDARGLTAPVHARRVSLASGAPVVTDGPYADTREVVAGYAIVECESFDRATALAARLIDPDAPGDYVDVRPILDGSEDLDN